MATLGISIARLEPGEVDLTMDYSADFTQQHADGAGGPRGGRERQGGRTGLTLLQCILMLSA
jgi:hypothetical protein